jgi:hypothetical protein
MAHGTCDTLTPIRGHIGKVPRTSSHGAIKAKVAVANVSRESTTVITIRLSSKGRGAKLPLAAHVEQLRGKVEELVGGILNAPRPIASLTKLAQRVEKVTTDEFGKAEVVRTKETNATIGVTSSGRLYDQLRNIAADTGVATAHVARRLFEEGLNTLDERLWDEASASVLKEFASISGDFGSEVGETKQWSLRLARTAYLKALFVAKEHGLSRSELADWCIAFGVRHHLDAHAELA